MAIASNTRLGGVHVFYLAPTKDPVADTSTEVAFTVQFNQPLGAEEAQRRGWEAAQADFVKRRLDS
jgi:hypothetical protein